MKVQWGEHFSVNTEMCGEDSVVLDVKGFGMVELKVGFKELTIFVTDDKDAAQVEVTVPHKVFGDGLPSIKISESVRKEPT